MELLKVLILGIVEGITEWLPISSTGHMILVDEFIHLNVSAAFKEMFLVVIQLGAILAVVVLFYDKLNPFTRKKAVNVKREIFSTWYKVMIGVIPAVIFGLLFDDWLNENLYNYLTVAVMLIFYGILFIYVENINRNKEVKVSNLAELSYKTAFLIGLFQVLALIPGTSRSGATILGAIMLGTSRSIAAEYSFFLSIPVMFGASLLKILKYGFNYTVNEIMLLLFGMLIAFIVSIISIKFLLRYIQKHDFKVFGWYRIIIGVIIIMYFFFM